MNWILSKLFPLRPSLHTRFVRWGRDMRGMGSALGYGRAARLAQGPIRSK